MKNKKLPHWELNPDQVAILAQFQLSDRLKIAIKVVNFLLLSAVIAASVYILIGLLQEGLCRQLSYHLPECHSHEESLPNAWRCPILACLQGESVFA